MTDSMMVVRPALRRGETWKQVVQRAGPRPWLVRNLLMAESLSLLVGRGGVGKSMLSLVIALFFVMGWDLTPRWTFQPTVYDQPTKQKALILASEDTRAEMLRRLAAIGTIFGINPDDIAGRIFIVTPEDEADSAGIKIKLFSRAEKTTFSGPRDAKTSTRSFALDLTALGQRLPDMVRECGAGLVILDPVAEISDVVENSNDEMGAVMEDLRLLARKCRVGMLAVHHDSKAGSADNGQTLGRGASVTRDKVRVGLGMRPLTEDDLDKHGPHLVTDKVVLARSAEDPDAPVNPKDLYMLTEGKLSYAARRDDTYIRMVSVDVGLVDALGAKELIGVPIPMRYVELDRAKFDIFGWSSLLAALDMIAAAAADGKLLSTGISRGSLREALRERFGPQGKVGLDAADKAISAMEHEQLIERAALDAKHADRTHWRVVEGARTKAERRIERAAVPDEEVPF